MDKKPHLNCLIVEDEPLAAGILEDFISQTPGLNLVGKCPDAHHAHDALLQQTVDVLFLDIHLPGMKGLDFLRTLTQPPQVILCTAFPNYALESYELGVVDYLVKPIDFQRFLKAVGKLRSPENTAKATRAFHFFNVNKNMVRVWLNEIEVIESAREYVILYLSDGQKLLTKYSLREISQLLQDFQLVQVHRSFLVATRHVQSFNAGEVITRHKQVPIGRLYRGALDFLSNGTAT
jgi:DNA-binding LytR/AlgR family response regulator